MSALTLVLPGVLDAPPDALRDISSEARALRDLISHPTSSSTVRSGFWESVAELLAIERQQDVPLAPIWAHGDGLDVGEAYWFVADPVALEAGRDDVRLVDATPALTREEAETIYATLNAHFAADGLRFVASTAGRWYLRVASAPALRTTPPLDAVGRALRPLLAAGADAPKWRRWQNEMQMLLFEHAVNQRRESDGKTVVNSIWCWAGGTLPPPPSDTPLCVFADQREVTQLAAYVHARAMRRAGFAEKLAGSASAALCVAPFAWTDLRAGVLDAQLAAELFLARRVAALTLIATGRQRQVRIRCARPGLLQRFARRGSLELDAAFAQWAADEDSGR